MAKKDKDKIYYELTREKPPGSFQLLLVGGTGTVFAFMISTLWGLYRGADLDGLVLGFLTSSFLGFFLGAAVIGSVLRFWGKSKSSSSATAHGRSESGATAEGVSSPVVEDEAAKGKSVDFVFPELNPDEQ